MGGVSWESNMEENPWLGLNRLQACHLASKKTQWSREKRRVEIREARGRKWTKGKKVKWDETRGLRVLISFQHRIMWKNKSRERLCNLLDMLGSWLEIVLRWTDELKRQMPVVLLYKTWSIMPYCFLTFWRYLSCQWHQWPLSQSFLLFIVPTIRASYHLHNDGNVAGGP